MLNFYDIVGFFYHRDVRDKVALYYLLLLHINTKHRCPLEKLTIIPSVLITCIQFKSKLKKKTRFECTYFLSSNKDDIITYYI